jgi:hypothetical protein
MPVIEGAIAKAIAGMRCPDADPAVIEMELLSTVVQLPMSATSGGDVGKE